MDTGRAEVPSAPLYPRGFSLSVNGAKAPLLPDFLSLDVPSFRLQYDALLEVDYAESEGLWVLVLGKAWYVGPSSKSRHESLAAELLDAGRVSVAAVEEMLYDVGGRYVVIAHLDSVYAWTDAAGTRSLFFDRRSERMASHFAMLADERSFSEGGHPYGRAVDPNILLDLTRDPGIYALLPNHRLDFWASRQVRFHCGVANAMRDSSVEGLLKVLDDIWGKTMVALIRLNVPLFVSVSGGLDSRTMLAMAREHLSHFQSFTYTSTPQVGASIQRRKWEDVLAADARISNAMRALLPSEHRVLVEENSDWVRENAATLDRNSEHRHGRWLLPLYMHMSSDRRAVHYRGNLFELGRNYWGSGDPDREASGSEPDDPLSLLYLVLRKHSVKRGVPYEAIRATCYSRGSHLGFDSLHPDYAVSDVAYWELRLGRWYSQVLNETDVAFDTITPINVRRALDALLAFPLEKREQGWVQLELIRRNYPALLRYGINDEGE